MSFSEFLIASGEKQLWESMLQLDYATIHLFDSRCKELLRQYYFTGGMPEAVAKWQDTHDPVAVRAIQNEILTTYDKDFSKHTRTMLQKIRMVWSSIPVQLAKENKKFIFGVLKKGARAAQYEEALQWLIDAGLIIRIFRCTKPVKPLKFYQDTSAFKIFLIDVGLLAAMAETDLRGLRCSMKPHIDQGWLENIPLWIVEAYFMHEAQS